jgi:hypothetical protein
VAIVNTAGKIPALTSTYFASVSFDAANLTGTAAAISGVNLTALNATQLTSGTLPSARLSGTYSAALTLSNASNAFTGDGSALTNLSATQLGTGTLPSARLSGTYSAALTFSNASNSFQGAHLASDGSAGLTQSCTNFTGTASIEIKNGLIVAITGVC